MASSGRREKVHTEVEQQTRLAQVDLLNRQPTEAVELRVRLPVDQTRPDRWLDHGRLRHNLALLWPQCQSARLLRSDPVPTFRHGCRVLERRRPTCLRRVRRPRLHSTVSFYAYLLLE